MDCKKLLNGILLLAVLLSLTGCAAAPQKKPVSPVPDNIIDGMSTKAKQWTYVLFESNKQFGLLVLIGVIGGAAAWYFREGRLLGIPVFCALGCFFIKFLITAGDLLSYLCIIAAVILLLYIFREKLNCIKELVFSIEPYKTEEFKQTANAIQSRATKQEVKKIKEA